MLWRQEIFILKEVDQDGSAAALCYGEFGDTVDGDGIGEADNLNNINIKAEQEDPDFR